jgi:hypothetical protein
MGVYNIRQVEGGYLKCSSCQETKPETFFNKSNSKKNTSKKTYVCKDCAKKKNRKYKNTETGYKNNLWNNLVGNAKRRNIPVLICKEDIDLIYKEQKGLCAVTGMPMEYVSGVESKNSFAVSVDRIDSNKGYTKDNVRLVCARVNLIKMEMEDEQMKYWCEAITKGLRK